MARKKNIVSQLEIASLQNEIKSICTFAIDNAIDCKNLSNQILLITGKYLSFSTLKRFFGFNKSDFSLSYDTINILKEYIAISKMQRKVSVAQVVIDFYTPKHFKEISKSDQSFQAASRTMALLLRENKNLFEETMLPLAQSKIGRAFYFELFPDYEILSSFQYKGYEHYLKYEDTHEGKLFANCVLFLKYFFDKDEKMMSFYHNKASLEYKKTKQFHPFVLGRYFQVNLIYNFLFNKKLVSKIIDEMYKSEKVQSINDKELFREFPGFHYFVCDGLWHAEEYEHLLKISEIALTDFEKHEEFIWKGYYDHLQIYHGLALSKLGKTKEASTKIKKIHPESFYFISKKYFTELFEMLKDNFKK
jgi:hypothetical protein